MGEGLYKSRVRLTNETGFAEIDLWLAFLTAQRAGQVDLIQQSGEPRVGIPFRGVYRGLDEATAVTIANLPPRLTFNETDHPDTCGHLGEPNSRIPGWGHRGFRYR